VSARYQKPYLAASAASRHFQGRTPGDQRADLGDDEQADLTADDEQADLTADQRADQRADLGDNPQAELGDSQRADQRADLTADEQADLGDSQRADLADHPDQANRDGQNNYLLQK
jgi:hypothetical protein